MNEIRFFFLAFATLLCVGSEKGKNYVCFSLVNVYTTVRRRAQKDQRDEIVSVCVTKLRNGSPNYVVLSIFNYYVTLT